ARLCGRALGQVGVYFEAFPAKMRSSFAWDNVAIESISSKSAQRFCVGQCVKQTDKPNRSTARAAPDRWTHALLHPGCSGDSAGRPTPHLRQAHLLEPPPAPSVYALQPPEEQVQSSRNSALPP